VKAPAPYGKCSGCGRTLLWTSGVLACATLDCPRHGLQPEPEIPERTLDRERP
jgi:hypothetical protein